MFPRCGEPPFLIALPLLKKTSFRPSPGPLNRGLLRQNRYKSVIREEALIFSNSYAISTSTRTGKVGAGPERTRHILLRGLQRHPGPLQ